MNSIKIRAILLFCILLCSAGIKAHVNLKSPVGGEVFNPGETVKIEWEMTVMHETENWDLFFSTDEGKTYQSIELNMDVKTLTYDWNVPYKTTKSARIKIVQDNVGGDYIDESENFTIAGLVSTASGSMDASKLQLYPNPASNEAYLRTIQPFPHIKKIVMSDISGRIINLPVDNLEEGKNEWRFEINNTVPGVYYLLIFMGEGMEVRKLIIQ